MIFKKILIPLLAICLTACSNVEVHKNSEKLEGIPFYIKVPQNIQETKLQKSVLAISANLSQGVEKNKITITLPETGPLIVKGNEHHFISTIRGIEKFLLTIENESYASTKKKLKDYLQSIDNGVEEERIISNTWSTQMVVGTAVHYISSRQPLIGTATSNFEFANDGTLTKASSTMTDETAATVLDLIPIASKISKQWDLESSNKSKSNDSEKISVTLEISSNSTIYSLKKFCKKICTQFAPLKLSDALSGSNMVQLVETINHASNEKSPAKPQEGYEIRGTIIPPKVKN